MDLATKTPSFREEIKTAIRASLFRRKTRLRSTAIRILPSKSRPYKPSDKAELLSLPAEIRERIYYYVFLDTLIWDGPSRDSGSHPKIDPSWKWIRQRLLPAYILLLMLLRFNSPVRTTTFILHFLNRMPTGGSSILRLNRQIHFEAQHVLYSQFVFAFTLRAFGNLPGESPSNEDKLPRSVKLAIQFANQLSRSACVSVRFLEITLLMPDILETGDVESDGLIKRRAQDHWVKTCTLFTSLFPSLVTVTLVVHPSIPDHHSLTPEEPAGRVIEIARIFGTKASITAPTERRSGFAGDSWAASWVKGVSKQWEREKKVLLKRESERANAMVKPLLLKGNGISHCMEDEVKAIELPSRAASVRASVAAMIGQYGDAGKAVE